ncbi:MAG: hypothetical protein WB795_23765, partial [Candidatus Acidiferrales bacterium]
MSEDFPALIGCDGSREVVTERAELELSVQVTAEVPRENHAAGHLELCVSEVLDANPSSSAEEDDHCSSKTLMCKTLKERECRAKSANYIYKNDRPAGRKAAGQKLVVDVAVIGAENGLAAEETTDDRDAGIYKWNRECDQGRGH